MPRQSHLTAFLLVVCLAFSTVTAFAADALTGKVSDAQGKAIAGAIVTVQTGDRSPLASTTSDAQGAFSFATLPAGNYLVVVTHGAFAEARMPVTVAASDVC